jgi:exopolysaccharide production protein ExoQ
MSLLLLLATAGAGLWAVRRDAAFRPGVSSAIWIPTVWLAILASRPFSLWFDLGGAATLEGSPLDRAVFFALITAAAIVLARRPIPWGDVARHNWPLLLFYGYLLVSICWAHSPFVSLRRWGKEAGNILIVLLILSERDPIQAFRAVVVRCACLLLPLSVILIRHFPDLGRRYSQHSGGLEVTGVTTQKNALGATVLVCATVVLFDWLERRRAKTGAPPFSPSFVPPALLALGLWLLALSQSRTSMLAFGSAALLLLTPRLPIIRRQLARLIPLLVLGVTLLIALEALFDWSRPAVTELGREMTFTGRTDVWRELLALRTDPLIGTGFMSLWDDPQHRARLPEWVAFSAHNGYLEVYLAGGIVGVGLLALLLASTALRLHRALARPTPWAIAGVAILVATIVANCAESHFGCMTPIGLLYLTAHLGS